MTAITDAAIGDALFAVTVEITRDRLVRYAAASGDFNPIHYNDAAAAAAGLPGVIAHGMLTMGLAGSALTDWLGGPERVASFGVRFTRPVEVPALGGVELQITGTLGAIEDDGVHRVDLRVCVDGATVLGRAQARVRTA